MNIHINAPLPPFIDTKRLRLRPHRLSDCGPISETLSDFRVTRMLARVPYPYGEDDARDWLNLILAPDDGWHFAITQPADDVHIGTISIEHRQQAWHLGYYLNRYYWGRGFMSEAASGLIERFFSRHGNVALHSGAYAENRASQRVQEKLGFRVTGLRDLYSVSTSQMIPEVTTELKANEFQPFEFA
ncbi:GNAT family N-acetyltransferase [Martelella alba]|nr:GNAT family N-acetyltransferase [Martelella alba]